MLLNVFFFIGFMIIFFHMRKRKSPFHSEETDSEPKFFRIFRRRYHSNSVTSLTSDPLSLRHNTLPPLNSIRNPFAKVLIDVGHLIADTEYTDVSLLEGLNTVIASAVKLRQNKESYTALQEITTHLLQDIKDIRFKDTCVGGTSLVSSNNPTTTLGQPKIALDGGDNNEGIYIY